MRLTVSNLHAMWPINRASARPCVRHVRWGMTDGRLHLVHLAATSTVKRLPAAGSSICFRITRKIALIKFELQLLANLSTQRYVGCAACAAACHLHSCVNQVA